MMVDHVEIPHVKKRGDRSTSLSMLTSVVLMAAWTTPPTLRTSTLPGNAMFDPLHLSTKDLTFHPLSRPKEQILFDYYEAEQKHGRLAMLAAVAYPAQETLHPLLSARLQLPDRLADTLSPSLVNGDLPPATLVAFLGFASALELAKMRVESDLPGDYNWRFTDVTTEEDLLKLMAGETWNGRVAMLAVLGYVVQEAVTRMPVLSL